jgi:predicted ABC-type ATPase
LYLDLADTWQVFDNSALAGPRLIAARMPGEETRLIDADAWRNLLELSR